MVYQTRTERRSASVRERRGHVNRTWESRLYPGLQLWACVREEDWWAERVPAGWAAQRQILRRTRPDRKGRQTPHTHTHTHSARSLRSRAAYLKTTDPMLQHRLTAPDSDPMRLGRVCFHKLVRSEELYPCVQPGTPGHPVGLGGAIRLVFAAAEH